jgi:hypothetical protein
LDQIVRIPREPRFDRFTPEELELWNTRIDHMTWKLWASDEEYAAGRNIETEHNGG